MFDISCLPFFPRHFMQSSYEQELKRSSPLHPKPLPAKAASLVTYTPLPLGTRRSPKSECSHNQQSQDAYSRSQRTECCACRLRWVPQALGRLTVTNDRISFAGGFIILYGVISAKIKNAWYLGEACKSFALSIPYRRISPAWHDAAHGYDKRIH